MALLWQYFTLILQWFAEPQGCDEPGLHQTDVQPDTRVQSHKA